MAKQPKLLSDLFHDTLKDVYFAEKKILTTLPKMAKAAQSKDLRRPSSSTSGKPGDKPSASSRCSKFLVRRSRQRSAKRSWGSPKRVPRL